MKTRKTAWIFSAIILSTLPFLASAQIDYCKYKRESDCMSTRAIKLKARDLDAYLFDLENYNGKEPKYIFVQGDLSDSKNADNLAKYEIKDLVLRKGRLTKIPEWVFDIKTLETLDLGDNYIDELSPEICTLYELKDLYLWVNDLHNLPFCVNEMVNLRRVDMTGIKLNIDDQKNLSNSFRAVNFIFSEPCLCNFSKED